MKKNNNKKILVFSILGVCAVASLLLYNSDLILRLKGNECSHNGFHYLANEPSVSIPGNKEFWTCCSCNKAFLEKPEGNFKDRDIKYADFGYLGFTSEHIAYIPPSGTPEYKWSEKERYSKYYSGDTMWNDSVVMYEHDDGKIYGKLFYAPKKIIACKNYFFTADYKEGIDYEIKDDKIYKLQGSKMPYLTNAAYHCQNYKSDGTGVDNTNIGRYQSNYNADGYVLYSEYPHIVKYSIAVSYTHESSWDGHEVYKLGNHLPKTRTILDKGSEGELKLAIFGDSNATGAVTSKYWIDDYEGTHPGASTMFTKNYPSQEGFPEGFCDEINRNYGTRVKLYNSAVGGKDTAWAVSTTHAEQKFTYYDTNEKDKLNMEVSPSSSGQENYKVWMEEAKTKLGNYPDLIYLSFGNNDLSFGTNAQTFMSRLATIMDYCLTKNPNIEFIIGLPKRSNPMSNQDNTNIPRISYLKAVKEYCYKTKSVGYAVQDMTTFASDLLKHKNPYDIFGNGINHCNDFFARGFVQTFMTTLEMPDPGHEYDINKDPTMTGDEPEEKKYGPINEAKNWSNVIHSSTAGTISDTDNGVTMTSLETWGEGYKFNQKLTLDGLEFDFIGNKMCYGGSVTKDGKTYSLTSNVGFFFSKNQGSWTPSTAYPFEGLSFNLIDAYGQARIYVGKTHDYSQSSILYKDSSCTTKANFLANNEIVLNRLQNGDNTDRIGVHITFSKLDSSTYSINIKEYYPLTIWESNPNYDSNTKSVTYYLKSSDLTFLNADGGCYLNTYGFDTWAGTPYTKTNEANASVFNLKCNPTIVGNKNIEYTVGCEEDLIISYNKNYSDCEFMGISLDGDAIDISDRSIVDQTISIHPGFFKEKATKGQHILTLKTTTGTCSWNLLIK